MIERKKSICPHFRGQTDFFFFCYNKIKEKNTSDMSQKRKGGWFDAENCGRYAEFSVC